jgi:arylformamidase
MSKKKIYDISLPLSTELPLWPGDPAPVIERFSKMEDGEDANVSCIEMGVHFGTHIDAPFHFVADGSKVEDVPLDLLIGPAQVVEIPQDCDVITADILKAAGLTDGVKRLLFKTRNSQHWVKCDTKFDQDFVALSVDGARYLIEKGVRLVGIDYLSIASFYEPVPTHITLLKGGVVVVENLDLSAVPAGLYELICLPLNISGAEGAPARVVLVQDEP